MQEIVRNERMNTDTKTELIEKNMKLVFFIAQKYFYAGIEKEDVVSVGSLGLVKAANSFNPNKDVKFGTYAAKCIENEILMSVRRAKRYVGKEISLYSSIRSSGSKDEEFLLVDILQNGEDDFFKHVEEEAETMILLDAMKKLSDMDQTIIKLLYGLENTERKTQNEVAYYFKVTQSYISRRKLKALQRLKHEIERYM